MDSLQGLDDKNVPVENLADVDIVKPSMVSNINGETEEDFDNKDCDESESCKKDEGTVTTQLDNEQLQQDSGENSVTMATAPNDPNVMSDSVADLPEHGVQTPSCMISSVVSLPDTLGEENEVVREANEEDTNQHHESITSDSGDRIQCSVMTEVEKTETDVIEETSSPDEVIHEQEEGLVEDIACGSPGTNVESIDSTTAIEADNDKESKDGCQTDKENDDQSTLANDNTSDRMDDSNAIEDTSENNLGAPTSPHETHEINTNDDHIDDDWTNQENVDVPISDFVVHQKHENDPITGTTNESNEEDIEEHTVADERNEDMGTDDVKTNEDHIESAPKDDRSNYENEGDPILANEINTDNIDNDIVTPETMEETTDEQRTEENLDEQTISEEQTTEDNHNDSSLNDELKAEIFTDVAQVVLERDVEGNVIVTEEQDSDTPHEKTVDNNPLTPSVCDQEGSSNQTDDAVNEEATNPEDETEDFPLDADVSESLASPPSSISNEDGDSLHNKVDGILQRLQGDADSQENDSNDKSEPLLCVIEGVHGGAPDLNSSVQQDSDEDCVLIDSCDVSKEVETIDIDDSDDDSIVDVEADMPRLTKAKADTSNSKTTVIAESPSKAIPILSAENSPSEKATDRDSTGAFKKPVRKNMSFDLMKRLKQVMTSKDPSKNKMDDESSGDQQQVPDSTVSGTSLADVESVSSEGSHDNLPDDLAAVNSQYHDYSAVKREVKTEPADYDSSYTETAESSLTSENQSESNDRVFVKQEQMDTSHPVPVGLISHVKHEATPQQPPPAPNQIYMDVDIGGIMLAKSTAPPSQGKASSLTAQEKLQECLCLLCKRSFQRVEINNHLSTFHKQRNYKCAFCRYITDDLTKLVDHVSTHKNRYYFECTKCRMFFLDKGASVNHVRKMHSSSDLKKKTIITKETRFARKIVDRHAGHIKDYKSSVYEGERFSCCFCEETFDFASNAVKHITDVHNESQIYPRMYQPRDIAPCVVKTASDKRPPSPEKETVDNEQCDPAESPKKETNAKPVSKSRFHGFTSGKSFLKKKADRNLGTMKCCKCHQFFCSVASVKRHLMTVHKVKKVTDDMFEKREPGSLKNLEPEAVRIKCFRCNKTFQNSTGCYKHLKYYHKVKNSEIRPYMYNTKVKSKSVLSNLRRNPVQKSNKPKITNDKSNEKEKTNNKSLLSEKALISDAKKKSLRLTLQSLKSVESAPKKDKIVKTKTPTKAEVIEKKKPVPQPAPSPPVQRPAPQMSQLDRVYQCRLCGFFVGGTNRSADLLFNHIAKDHSVVRFSCKECTFCTNAEADITKHIANYHVNMQYKCTLCSVYCSSEKAVMHHMETNHSNVSKKKINYQMFAESDNFHTKYDDMFANFYQEVSFTADSSNNLINHSSQVKCKLCMLVVSAHGSAQSVLEHHLVSEHKVAKYRCNACSFSSGEQANMEAHLKTCSTGSKKPMKERYQEQDLSFFTSDLKPTQASNQTNTAMNEESQSLSSDLSDEDDSDILIESDDSYEEQVKVTKPPAPKARKRKKEQTTPVKTVKKVKTARAKASATKAQEKKGKKVDKNYKRRSSSESGISSSSTSTNRISSTPPKLKYCSFEGCQFECERQNDVLIHRTIHNYITIYKCSACNRYYSTNKSGVYSHMTRKHIAEAAYILVSHDKGLTYYPCIDDSSDENSD